MAKMMFKREFSIMGEEERAQFSREHDYFDNFIDITQDNIFYDVEKAIEIHDISDKIKIVKEWNNNKESVNTEKPIETIVGEIFDEKLLLEKLKSNIEMGAWLKVASESNAEIILATMNYCSGTCYEECVQKRKKVCPKPERCKAKVVKPHPYYIISDGQKDELKALHSYAYIRFYKQKKFINNLIYIDPKYIKELCILTPDRYYLLGDFESLLIKRNKTMGVRVLRETIRVINDIEDPDADIDVEAIYEQVLDEYKTEIKSRKKQKLEESKLTKSLKQENESLTKERDYLKNKCDDLEEKCNSMEIRLAELEKRLGIQTDSSGKTEEPEKAVKDDDSNDTDDAVTDKTVTADEESTENAESESGDLTATVNATQQISDTKKKVDTAKFAFSINNRKG